MMRAERKRPETSSPAPGDADGGWPTLVDALRWRAERQPNREAFTFLADGEADKRSVTYAELDRWARGIAAQLQAVAASGDRALIVCPTGLDYLAAVFGSLYAGIIAVPFYPPRADQDSDTLQSVLQAPDARIALSTTAVRSTMDSIICRVPALQRAHWLTVDGIADGLESDWQEPVLTGDSLACLMYTSGSTATPKGVMVSHGNILAMLNDPSLSWKLTSDDRMVAWSPLQFAMGMYQVMMAPLGGAPLTILPTAAVMERPLRWLALMSRARATHSGGPTFVFDLCTRVIPPEERERLDLSNWQVAWVGGDAVRLDVLERFAATFASCGFRREALTPAYGMSEGGGLAAGKNISGPLFQSFQTAALEQNRVVPTSPGEHSRTLPGHRVTTGSQEVLIVRTDALVLAAPDEVGEIWASGPNIARGYWNQPEETERTFRGFLADTGEGPFLRTGDLGFLQDGYLFITGRLKEMVIIRGRNLYPADLERTVERSHPASQSGARATFAVDIDDEERLVIVQEVDPEGEDLQKVAAAIRRAVVEHHEIQPHAVVLVKPGTVPRTSTGKVQRPACRAAFLDGRLEILERSVQEKGKRTLRAPYIPPRTPIEATLAAIWQEVLQVDRVGIDDHFSDLGGDSLLGMQILARIRQAGLGITQQQFSELPTIAELAGVVGTHSTAVQAEQGRVSGPVPLVPSQHRLLERKPDRIDSQSVGLNFELPGDVIPELLEEAVRHLLVHHDALRLRFWEESETWRQVNLADEEHRVFTHIDVQGLSEDEQSRTIKSAIREVRARISLSAGPLVQAVLFTRGPYKPAFLRLITHHLATDAYSSSILAQDLETVYLQRSREQPVRLPPKTTSFKTWAERLVEYAHSPELVQERDYWLDPARSQAPGLPLEQAPDSSSRGAHEISFVYLDPEETHALLHELPSVYGCQVIDVLLTALVLGFAEWTSSRSLLVDLSRHGREPVFPDLDASRTVGWFQTVFPVLLDLGSESGAGEGLRAVTEQLGRIPRHGIGYGVLRYLSDDREVVQQLRHLPESAVTFNYHGQSDRLAGLSFFKQEQWVGSTGSRHRARSRHPVPTYRYIQVIGGVAAGRLRLRFRHHEHAYRRPTIELVAQHVLEALRRLIRQADPNLDHFPLRG